MFKKLFQILLLAAYPCCQLSANGWYSEYWQRLYWKMWEKKDFELGTYVKLETENHLKNLRLYELSEQFTYRVSKNFSLEIHYSYIHGRSVVKDTQWRWQHRIELEANPVFRLPQEMYIQTRNRLEIERQEKLSKTQYRIRQWTMLVIPIKNRGKLKSFSIVNELFYEFRTHEFNQDRITPVQFTFAVTEKIDLDLFFMMRFFLHEEHWKRSAVLGTYLRF